MSKTKRQHFVPRFLLKRFASRVAGSESFVWQFRRGAPAVEVNVVNAGVEKYFYGDEDQTVEQGLAARESNDRQVLDRVEDGATLENLAEDLWQFTWLQFVRTRAIRQRFESTVRELIERMRKEADPRSVRRRALAEAERTIDGMVEQQFPHLSLKDRWPIRQHLMKQLQASPDLGLEPYQALIAKAEELVDWAQVSQDGHLKGLRKLLDQGPSPKSWRPKHWTKVTGETGTFVLGDGVVVAMSGDRPVFPSGGDADCDAVYVPISSRTCLVGRGKGTEPVLAVGEINRLLAEQSLDAMYSSRNDHDTARLAALVGKHTNLLDGDEMRKLVAEQQVGILPPKKSIRS